MGGPSKVLLVRRLLLLKATWTWRNIFLGLGRFELKSIDVLVALLPLIFHGERIGELSLLVHLIRLVPLDLANSVEVFHYEN